MYMYLLFPVFDGYQSNRTLSMASWQHAELA